MSLTLNDVSKQWDTFEERTTGVIDAIPQLSTKALLRIQMQQTLLLAQLTGVLCEIRDKMPTV